MMATSLPLMKSLMTHLRSTILGEIVDHRNQTRRSQSDLAPSEILSRPWQRLRGSLSAIELPWSSQRLSLN